MPKATMKQPKEVAMKVGSSLFICAHVFDKIARNFGCKFHHLLRERSLHSLHHKNSDENIPFVIQLPLDFYYKEDSK